MEGQTERLRLAPAHGAQMSLQTLELEIFLAWKKMNGFQPDKCKTRSENVERFKNFQKKKKKSKEDLELQTTVTLLLAKFTKHK